MNLTFEDLKSGKVRLEFGNTEQIEVIKNHQRVLAERETLKKYRVEISVSGSYTVEVEAHDEDEAKELAMDEGICEVDYDDVSVESIEKI